MSLFRPDGTYMGEIPSWFTPPDPRKAAPWVQMAVYDTFPIRDYAKGISPNEAMIKTITFHVGKHRNGAWRYRFADQSSLDAYDEIRKSAEKW